MIKTDTRWMDIKTTPPPPSLPIIVSDGIQEYHAKALWVESKDKARPIGSLTKMLDELGVTFERANYRRSMYAIEDGYNEVYKTSERLKQWRFRT